MKRLGFVLEGGRVCKDERSVATVDYPEADAAALTKKHEESLSGAGWKVETPSEGIVYATKDSDTLFIVTGKKSEDRKVPFAVVRYCENEGCRSQLSELAQAMKK